MARISTKFFQLYGYDLLLGSIAALYVFLVPYTKVEESFNVQAMHDILYHRHHIDSYDHVDFPGVVPRTFTGAILVSILASPLVTIMSLLHLQKTYSLLAESSRFLFLVMIGLVYLATSSKVWYLWVHHNLGSTFKLHSERVRLVLGCIILSTLRYFRSQIRIKFGHQVEAFFVILTAIQFHFLFYCTRPLPNILAVGLVNLAYGNWLRGNFYAALNCLISATIIFRCDILLLLCPLGLELLLARSISVLKALKSCIGTALFCIGLTVLVDSIFWRRWVWPEFEVLWFNSVLNKSSEWGTHPFHWYFTSALPRSLLAAYPLFLLGIFLDQRGLLYVLPVLLFVILYSKLPHKELRFIISSVPMFNLSAAIAANRIYNNRRKGLWNLLYLAMLGLLMVSLGCTIITFMASYQNYPSGYALRDLHKIARLENSTNEELVHVDTFSAMNGISRFCEEESHWRYSKEENISLEGFRDRNFTYLLNEHTNIKGFKCLFSVNGFSRMRIKLGFPPISLVNEPKVFVHGNRHNQGLIKRRWPGC